jgi:hypothetical protein
VNDVFLFAIIASQRDAVNEARSGKFLSWMLLRPDCFFADYRKAFLDNSRYILKSAHFTQSIEVLDVVSSSNKKSNDKHQKTSELPQRKKNALAGLDGYGRRM